MMWQQTVGSYSKVLHYEVQITENNNDQLQTVIANFKG